MPTDQPENDWTGIATADLVTLHAALEGWGDLRLQRIRDEIAAELDYRDRDA